VLTEARYCVIIIIGNLFNLPALALLESLDMNAFGWMDVCWDHGMLGSWMVDCLE
jgi:hypothetical protein